MSGNPIPSEALDDRLGFVGTAGSGKTYAAGICVEWLLHRNRRVVIPDPLGVWWGLAVDADGKQPSAWRKRGRLVIFGGRHGDLPLTEHAGALIGETVAGMAETAILDLSELGTKAAERRFMLEFLSALYRRTTGEPLHVVFDEADMWSPQRLIDKEGESAKLLGMMETIVRRGRVKGFIPWLITQRPAVVSKDVLSQIDGLVALKLTSSQDRDAIGDWVQGQADKQQWRELWGSLPTMQIGQGIVWVPARGVLERAQFPRKVTFDSSRTPKRGEKQHQATLPPLDLDALKSRLAGIEAEAKANDPVALKRQVAELQRQLREASKAAPDPAIIEGAMNRAYAQGSYQARRDASARVAAIASEIDRRLQDFRADLVDQVRSVRLDAHPIPAAAPPHTAGTAAPHKAISQARPAPAPRSGGGNVSLTNPQRELLRALAWWRAMGHEEPTRTQVAAIAGWKPRGSNLRNRLTEFSTAGLIEYPRTGLVRLTPAGIAAAPDPDTSMTLIDSIRPVLTNPQRQLFEALLEADRQMQRAELAAIVGWEAGGSNLRNRLTEMSQLELVSYPSRGEVKLQAWVLGR